MNLSSRTERLGLAAGTVSALLWVAIVVPRTEGLLRGSVSTSAVSDSGGAGLFAMGATLVVGLVAGLVQARYADHGGVEWAELARAIYYGPLAVFGLVLVAVVLGNAVRGLAAGGLVVAVGAALVTLVLGLLAGAVLAVGLGAVVAAPAVVGVYAGVRVGRATRSDEGDDTGGERDSPWAGDSSVSRTGSTGGGTVESTATWRERLAARAPWRVERASPERYGWWAGVAGTLAILVPQVAGPWSTLALDLSGKTPLSGSVEVNRVALLGGAAVAVLGGVVAAVRYHGTVDAPAANHRRRMVWQAVLAPMMLAFAAVLVVLVADGAAMALTDGVRAGLFGVVGAVLGAMLVGPVAGVMAAVVVGVPTVVGVALGDAIVHTAGD